MITWLQVFSINWLGSDIF